MTLRFFFGVCLVSRVLCSFGSLGGVTFESAMSTLRSNYGAQNLRFPILGAIAEELQNQFPQLEKGVIYGAVKSGFYTVAADEGFSEMDTVCLRDYSRACPEDWSDLGDGGRCSAPDWYDGQCANVISFAKMSAKEKSEKASSCGLSWPCTNSCTENFEAACPTGWTPSGSTCTAPESYDGPCVRRVSFESYGNVLKRKWAAICAVTWPC